MKKCAAHTVKIGTTNAAIVETVAAKERQSASRTVFLRIAAANAPITDLHVRNIRILENTGL